MQGCQGCHKACQSETLLTRPEASAAWALLQPLKCSSARVYDCQGAAQPSCSAILSSAAHLQRSCLPIALCGNMVHEAPAASHDNTFSTQCILTLIR